MMNVYNKDPEDGFGYVYILSNESMPGIFKVGYTTSSVKKRARELGTTGIPTNFKAEKIFLIKYEFLRKVEAEAHRQLKTKGLHKGKEFFTSELEIIVQVVEDVVYKVVGEAPDDLIGQAKKRAEERRREQEEKERQAEKIRKQKEEIKNYIDRKNCEIDKRRDNFVKNFVDASSGRSLFERKIIKPAEKAFEILFVFFFIGLAFYFNFSLGVVASLCGYAYFHNKKYQRQEALKRKAEIQFPYYTLNDFERLKEIEDKKLNKPVPQALSDNPKKSAHNLVLNENAATKVVGQDSSHISYPEKQSNLTYSSKKHNQRFRKLSNGVKYQLEVKFEDLIKQFQFNSGYIAIEPNFKSSAAILIESDNLEKAFVDFLNWYIEDFHDFDVRIRASAEIKLMPRGELISHLRRFLFERNFSSVSLYEHTGDNIKSIGSWTEKDLFLSK